MRTRRTGNGLGVIIMIFMALFSNMIYYLIGWIIVIIVLQSLVNLFRLITGRKKRKYDE